MITAERRQLAQVFGPLPPSTGRPAWDLTWGGPVLSECAVYYGLDIKQFVRRLKLDELRGLALEVAPGAVELLDSLGDSWEGGIKDLVTAARCCGAQVPTDRELQRLLVVRHPLPRGKAPRQSRRRRPDHHSHRPAGTDRASSGGRVRGRRFR